MPYLCQWWWMRVWQRGSRGKWQIYIEFSFLHISVILFYLVSLLPPLQQTFCYTICLKLHYFRRCTLSTVVFHTAVYTLYHDVHRFGLVLFLFSVQLLWLLVVPWPNFSFLYVKKNGNVAQRQLQKQFFEWDAVVVAQFIAGVSSLCVFRQHWLALGDTIFW